MTKTATQHEFVFTICESIKKEARNAIMKKNSFTLVLSGGNTPKYIFEELAKSYKEKIEWSKVHLFWLDERCVPVEHEESNFKLAKDYLLDHVKVSSIHRMEGELNPEFAAQRYEENIKDFFSLKIRELPSFDLILLGMGEDGHCASLFPHAKELLEDKCLVLSTQKEYNGHKRITLTLPVINNSKGILMINSQKKLDAFNRKNKKLPIHLLNEKNMKVVVNI